MFKEEELNRFLNTLPAAEDPSSATSTKPSQRK
jgi:hypothetical protein